MITATETEPQPRLRGSLGPVTPPVLAHFHIGRVDPQVRPVTLDRSVEERVDALIDVLAQAAHLALGDAVHAQRLDQIIDRTR